MTMRRWGMLAAAALALAVGCQSRWLEPPQWTVTLSPLDYVQFLMARAGAGAADAGKVRLLRVELIGNGYLSYCAGRSPRVTDDFWTERDSSQWDDYHQDGFIVPKAYTLGCFQHLVDTGFFEDSLLRPDSGPASTNGIFVVASINGRKKAALTKDPQVETIVRELMKQF